MAAAHPKRSARRGELGSRHARAQQRRLSQSDVASVLIDDCWWACSGLANNGAVRE